MYQPTEFKYFIVVGNIPPFRMICKLWKSCGFVVTCNSDNLTENDTTGVREEADTFSEMGSPLSSVCTEILNQSLLNLNVTFVTICITGSQITLSRLEK